ncbi:ATP-binding protein, partial [Streptomyces sp. XM4011]|nr:ATP-binding protein [Streptomyces sp. XM4011]
APESAPPATRAATAATAASTPAASEDLTEYGESGLPKRRRGRTLAAAHADHDPPTRKLRPRANHSPAETAARFGTFRRAVRGEQDTAPGRDAPAADTPTSQPEDENS